MALMRIERIFLNSNKTVKNAQQLLFRDSHAIILTLRDQPSEYMHACVGRLYADLLIVDLINVSPDIRTRQQHYAHLRNENCKIM
jgi:hypothetical protein